MYALGTGALKWLLQSFSHSKGGSRSELSLAQSCPQWCAMGHAQVAHGHPRRYGWHLLSAGTTACLQNFFRHFQPNGRRKSLPGSLAAEAAQDSSLCTPFHTAPALGENPCPVHMETLSPHIAPSGDLAAADAITPGAKSRAADPRLCGCWRAGHTLPAALPLSGEHELARTAKQHVRWRICVCWRSTVLIQP